jgi:hypothetical protein
MDATWSAPPTKPNLWPLCPAPLGILFGILRPRPNVASSPGSLSRTAYGVLRTAYGILGSAKNLAELVGSSFLEGGSFPLPFFFFLLGWLWPPFYFAPPLSILEDTSRVAAGSLAKNVHRIKYQLYTIHVMANDVKRNRHRDICSSHLKKL